MQCVRWHTDYPALLLFLLSSPTSSSRYYRRLQSLFSWPIGLLEDIPAPPPRCCCPLSTLWFCSSSYPYLSLLLWLEYLSELGYVSVGVRFPPRLSGRKSFPVPCISAARWRAALRGDSLMSLRAPRNGPSAALGIWSRGRFPCVQPKPGAPSGQRDVFSACT